MAAEQLACPAQWLSRILVQLNACKTVTHVMLVFLRFDDLGARALGNKAAIGRWNGHRAVEKPFKNFETTGSFSVASRQLHDGTLPALAVKETAKCLDVLMTDSLPASSSIL